MLDFEPYAGPTKLLVALDIGTIYSSISYCMLEHNRIPKVRTVTRYPGQGVACADAKLPSLLYYDRSGGLRAAGAEVLTQDVIETALTEGWQKVEWWKLHLRPGHLEFPFEGLPPLPSEKSVVDVLSDFIKYLSHCCKTYIQGRHSTFSWSSVEDSIEYILTYPGGWDEQQYMYRHAIQLAGLIPSTSEGQKRVHMLTEGEACLNSYLALLREGDTASPAGPEGVVVIDAGGGIVGLSPFSLTRMPNLSTSEIAPPESRLQGSLFVSCRAKALMEKKLEGWEHSGTEDIARFTREFDQTTKLVIDSDQVPAYVRVADRRTESGSHCISSGQLKLSGREATELFHDPVEAIVTAFEKHQKSAPIPIQTAFVVGGLAKNDWVWFQLQSYCSARGIAICRPTNHNRKVVAQGAVLHAIAMRSVNAPSASPSIGSSTGFACRKGCTHNIGDALPVHMMEKPRVQRPTFRDCLGRIFARVHALVQRYNPRERRVRTEKYVSNISMKEAAYSELYRGLVPYAFVQEK